MQTHIGISGWTYAPWRGTFYPKKLRHRDELPFASRHVNSIEINGTFYSLQRPNNFADWYAQTPDDFLFSLKGGRFITHMKRLKNVEIALANFFASGVLRLNEKLGPILWQLPPNFQYDEAKLAAFFELLPRDTTAAARLARKHEPFLKTRSWTKTDKNRPLRYALEVRHESFKTPAFPKLLKKHHIALCVAETAGKWPYFEDITTDFVYVRLHGDEELYVSGYTDAALERWSERLKTWRKRRDVYVYFDNDVKVRAPMDAMNLARRLGIKTPDDVEMTPSGEIMERARESWPAISRPEPGRVGPKNRRQRT